MARGGKQGGGLLTKVVGGGVGMVAEYRAHRQEQKLSRESSRQDETTQAGPSTRPQLQQASSSSSRDLPPAYTDVADEKSERSLASEKAAPGDKKAALAQYDDRSSSDEEGETPLEHDEVMWELDEAGEGKEPPAYEEGEGESAGDKPAVPVEDLVRQVIESNKAALAAAPGFERSALPFPVIVPQRRPRKKARGFVRAYAPYLGECSGIDQETFLMFIENFDKASQASPVWGVIQLSAAIAGFAPSVIAMAVTTAAQIGARIGEEVEFRQRSNSFLDKMNEQMFKPAGLFAMLVKYKSEQEVLKDGNSALARLGVSGTKIDFNTNQAIAKYDRTLSDKSDGSGGGGGLSSRMQKIRLASGETRGAFQLPESCPLIFPNVDKAIAKDGPETFKDKTKDFKGFLGDYMDRRAQKKYATDDPNSSLALPESQRAFKSKLADPNHPMFNGGLIGLVSGGALTRDRGSYSQGYGQGQGQGYVSGYNRGYDPRQDRHSGRDERRMMKYEQRMADGRDLSRKKQRRYDRMVGDGYGYEGQSGMYGQGYGGRSRGGGPLGLVGGLISAATGSGQNREYEDSYNNRLAPAPYGGDDRYARRSFDDRRNAPAPHAPYGGQQPYGDSYGGRSEDQWGQQQGGQYGSQYPYEDDHRYGNQQPYGRQSPGYAGYGNQSRYGGQSGGRRGGGGGGLLGGVKKLMSEEVLYLMIVNMPSEAELAEAREAIARAKSGR